MTVASESVAEAASRKSIHGNHHPYLFAPVVDFMLLGGGSVLAMIAIQMLVPESDKGKLATIMIILANFINHPHFAGSYMLFYENYSKKAFGQQYSWDLRYRYLLAGVAVPTTLLLFLLYTILFGPASYMRASLSLMYFFVGWHYVKQGYGMLMLDAALKRNFFSTIEKKIFLVNAYVVWLLTWLLANGRPRSASLFGVESYHFEVPEPLTLIAAAVAGVSFIAALAVLFRRVFVTGEAIAWNGVIAYGVSVYVWMLTLPTTVSFLIIPAAHSLQYLAVVARYQFNRLNAGDGKSLWPSTRFFLYSAILGAGGFWIIPAVLEVTIPHREEIGTLAFLPAAWIFINVHHYFIDNVIWRAENKDVNRYLFH